MYMYSSGSLSECLQKDSVTVHVQERIMNSLSAYILANLHAALCVYMYICPFDASGVYTTIVFRVLGQPCDRCVERTSARSWDCCRSAKRRAVRKVADLLKNARQLWVGSLPQPRQQS